MRWTPWPCSSLLPWLLVAQVRCYVQKRPVARPDEVASLLHSDLITLNGVGGQGLVFRCRHSYFRASQFYMKKKTPAKIEIANTRNWSIKRTNFCDFHKCKIVRDSRLWGRCSESVVFFLPHLSWRLDSVSELFGFKLSHWYVWNAKEPLLLRQLHRC